MDYKQLNFSYDYEELLNELKSDLFEGLITPNEKIKIVKSKNPITAGYFPIVDYYYSNNQPSEEFEEMQALKVVAETEYMNKVIK